MSRRAIVTGGAGFIGSNLVDRLVKEGWEVVVIDNLFSGFRKNLAHHGDKVKLVIGSITDRKLAMDVIKKGDTIWHFAAMNSVPRSIEFPWESNDANVNGTLNLLIVAKDKKARRFIYSGSSSAYGDAKVDVKHEGLPARPISPYGLSKHSGEEYSRLFSAIYGLPTVTLRYFNVFGPRQNPTSPYSAVVPIFVNAMMQDKPITIFGDGGQSRDFTYVANVVEANMLAGQKDAVEPGTYNVACGDSISVNEVVKKIEKLTGYKFKAEHKPPRVGDVRTSMASIKKIQDSLGYQPVATFDKGLQMAVEWYKQNPDYFKNIA